MKIIVKKTKLGPGNSLSLQSGSTLEQGHSQCFPRDTARSPPIGAPALVSCIHACLWEHQQQKRKLLASLGWSYTGRPHTQFPTWVLCHTMALCSPKQPTLSKVQLKFLCLPWYNPTLCTELLSCAISPWGLAALGCDPVLEASVLFQMLLEALRA